MKARVPLEVRFWAKVDRRGPDECWPWTAAKKPDGYGSFRPAGRQGGLALAHRIAWELTQGPIPPGKQVLHECDQPPCCNPAHLFLGDNVANVKDKVAKGRQARGEACAIRGSRHGSAKLTEDDVRAIRAAVAAGELQRVVGSRYGITPHNVSRIVSGLAWSHVQ